MTPSAGPMFRQIAGAIAGAITDGTIAVGELLPGEQELARRHGVSRHTIREALAALRADGLVESRRGIGSCVVRRTAGAAYTEAYSSVEELIRFAQGAPLQPYDVREVTADAALAALLRGREGQSYLRILGLRRHQGEALPAGHVEVYVDATYAGIAASLHALRASVAETIEARYGLRIARIDQEIAAGVIAEAAASRLHAAPGTPALVIRRWYAADTGRIFEAAFSHYPAGRFTYRNVLLRRGG